LITANLALAVTGCATAVRRFLARGSSGAIVNVSSHQAQRPPGALPYATAKAAIEGVTSALAVDYGPHGIRTNAVPLGTIATERYETLVAERPDVEADPQPASARPCRPTGRGRRDRRPPLSPATSFVNGVVLAVDGGRAVLGLDSEARPVS
jgi:NAD(P)-dependent dehydrogenase (short-subunit alcohol dehydrogenase family)